MVDNVRELNEIHFNAPLDTTAITDNEAKDFLI